MKIVVLGGSGFLGSFVADRLSYLNHDVTIYDKKKSKWLKKNQKFIKGNILDIKLLDKVIKKAKVVYHFAALANLEEALHKPIETVNNNILGTVNVLEVSKNYNIRKSWHIVVFKLPIFGNLVAKSVLAKVSMVLGNLNQAGVDLIESIDIAKSVTTNIIIIESLENIKKGVFSGKTLTDSLANEKVFPSTFKQLISVGEQTGSLDEMYGSVATYYEEELDVAVANLSSLIEPIMIVFMGITIGGLMLAMYAPIFNVGAVIN